MVLKGLIRDFARKFIAFYGAQANAVLRKATIVLPSRARPEIADAVNMVSVLPDVWKKVGITIQ
jgi:nucleoporin GLE1